MMIFESLISKLTMKLFSILISILILASCQNQSLETKLPISKSKTEKVHVVASEYFATFSERKDWQKLLSFYRADMTFDDVLLQIHLDSLWQFERFYNWPDTGFHKLTPDQEHLVIESLVANDSVAVVNGHLNPFYYYGELVDSKWGMKFTIWLYFDEDFKIKHQVDWFEYDDKVLESVINRIRKDGLRIPDWLDLSR